MKQLYKSIIIVLCTFALAGCQNMSKSDVGTMTGAVAGGLLGSTIGGGRGQVMAIAAGAAATNTPLLTAAATPIGANN